MRGDGSPLRKTAFVMVGLPARGKTYTARKLARYLSWRGYEARVFNVGNYRRERLGAHQPHSFFDPTNPLGAARRLEVAQVAMGDLLAWFAQGGEVGIYDATNSTRERRRWVHDRLVEQGIDVVFIELLCDDPEILEANIRETKLLSPDYSAMGPDEAVADFQARIAHYAGAYEAMDEDELPFVQLVDVNRRVVLNRIHGYLGSRVVRFLMNLHIVPRPIWLVRHGQSAFNLEDRIGGDSDLSPAGRGFAATLAAFVSERATTPVEVWTSTLVRAVHTGETLGRPMRQWRALDEIEAGACDGLTYSEMRARFPAEYAARGLDKLRYRYPGGESYEDLMDRLEPVILELERLKSPVLVVSHQAVLRALYGYFTNAPLDAIPHLPVPLHTVIEITPKAYGTDERRFPLNPGVIDTSL